MTARHTLGPWYADGDEVLVDQGDRALTLAEVVPQFDGQIRNANAVLMAASPELLMVAREALSALNAVKNTPLGGPRFRDTYQLASHITGLLGRLEN